MPHITVEEHNEFLLQKEKLASLLQEKEKAWPIAPQRTADSEQGEDAELKTSAADYAKLSQENESLKDQLADLSVQIEALNSQVDALLARSEKLAALEASGVDNWQGYGDAMALLKEGNEESTQQPQKKSGKAA